MSDNLLVSVIIVNYNGMALLEKCLSSLSDTQYNNYEVIVVDNSSSDGSSALVRDKYPHVTLVQLDRNYGFAKPNNIGAKKAKGEYLVFLNNDTEVSPEWLTELVKVAQHDTKIAICQSLLLKNDGIDSSGDFVDDLGRAYSDKNHKDDVAPILSARGAAMFAKKDFFWDLGGFDEKFFVSFEDIDIGWRAWLWGYKVYLVPKSVVYHRGRATISRLEEEIAFHAVKNSILLRLVNFEGGMSFRSLVVISFVILMRKLFGLTIVNDPEVAPPLPGFRTILKAVRWIVVNHSYVCSKKKLVNSRRIITTKDLMEKGLITKFSFR